MIRSAPPSTIHRYKKQKAAAMRLLFMIALCCYDQAFGLNSACGTFEHPFSDTSPWNSRPVEPVLGTDTIPLSTYFPTVSSGIYSSNIYIASTNEAEMTVFPLVGKSGIWDPDSEQSFPLIRVPHWPDGVVPASGSDGHADIIDLPNGIVHSFFKLKFVEGQWRALMYAWSPLNGSGWGDPSHYYQGARAAGVSTSGGLIRTHEVNDGKPFYSHALAMSLTYNALSANPTYVFPATSADSDAGKTNSGTIPMGSLMMLPPDFDVGAIESEDLKKVARTLKTYGAYVVDRNIGTPFVIYAEISSKLNLHKSKDGTPAWNNKVANDLQRIRATLRPVISAKSWIDCNGHQFKRTLRFNLMSMRGPWISGKAGFVAAYNTWKQVLELPDADQDLSFSQRNPNIWSRVTWAQPVSGKRYVLKVTGSDTGVSLRLGFNDCASDSSRVDTGPMSPGMDVTLTWPEKMCKQEVVVKKSGPGKKWIKGELWEAD